MVPCHSYPENTFQNFFSFLQAAQTSYLLYASDNNQNFKISKLDTNYYGVVSQTSVISGELNMPSAIESIESDSHYKPPHSNLQELSSVVV